MSEMKIQACQSEHLKVYGEIYAAAFNGEPWYDAWTVEDATTHVEELMVSKQFFGLECVIDGQVAGFVMGTSVLFHHGRTFDLHDLAVSPEFQGRGVAKTLMAACLDEVKNQGMVGANLITARTGKLPVFYEKFGFKSEDQVGMMGIDF